MIEDSQPLQVSDPCLLHSNESLYLHHSSHNIVSHLYILDSTDSPPEQRLEFGSHFIVPLPNVLLLDFEDEINFVINLIFVFFLSFYCGSHVNSIISPGPIHELTRPLTLTKLHS